MNVFDPFGIFSTKKTPNPADAANAELNKIPGATSPYYDPYINAGKEALGTLKDEYGNLLQDPGSIYDRLGKGYKESPGYQFALKQALGAGQNASAAGGMLGTPADQQQQMGLAQDVASKDFQKYLDSVTGLYGKGLSGTEGLNKQGFDASTEYGKMLADIFGQKSSNIYQGTAGQNAAGGNKQAQLMQMISTFLPFY